MQGDILFLHMSKEPIRAGEIVVFNVDVSAFVYTFFFIWLCVCCIFFIVVKAVLFYLFLLIHFSICEILRAVKSQLSIV